MRRGGGLLPGAEGGSGIRRRGKGVLVHDRLVTPSCIAGKWKLGFILLPQSQNNIVLIYVT
jgi:hypothetical protein